ncbi:MAG TPA: AraC family transcriptional regulator [Bacteroidales bacterium]|nr:AraC family transcriptional regulator [Bacteroidales bacterium]
MYPEVNTERSHYHFSFLHDIKVHGVYFNSLALYLNSYPFIEKPHSHDFYSLVLVNGGTGEVMINNERYRVPEKTVCLIAPDQEHSLAGLKDVDATVFFFCQDFYVEEFSFTRLLNVFSYTARVDRDCCMPVMSLAENEFGTFTSTMRSLRNEYESYTSGNNSATIIRSLLNILLLKLTDLYEKKADISPVSDSVLFHSLVHMIDTNFIQQHHLGFYSSALNISERQLNDICNKYFSCGLKSILQDRLMQEARKLLLSTEYSVSEIAYKLNFEDNSYFTKVFKSKTGLTPSRFRSLHIKLLPQNL